MDNTDGHCDSEFIGEINLGDKNREKTVGVCLNQSDQEDHYIVAGIKRDCVEELYNSPIFADAKNLRSHIDLNRLNRAKIRIYNGLCPMHLAGGKDAQILSEIDTRFDGVPGDLNLAIRAIAQQAVSQLKEIFDRYPDTKELLVDVAVQK